MAKRCVMIYSPQEAVGRLVEAMIGGCAAGLQVEVIGSASELLARAAATPPRLIIMLDTRPLIDGRDLATQLREATRQGCMLSTQRRTPLYVVTWQQDQHTVLSLLESGIDQYLTFPICIERLRHKVCEQLAGGSPSNNRPTESSYRP